MGQQVLQRGRGAFHARPEEIVSTDLKLYEAGGFNFAIAQVEVTDLLQLDEHLTALHQALDDLRERRGLDFAMLMVTDVVENRSRLITVNAPPMMDELPYPRQPDGTCLAEGVVSARSNFCRWCWGCWRVDASFTRRWRH